MAQLKKLIYGRTTERFVPEQPPTQQGNLFAQGEEEESTEVASAEPEEPVTETITYERKKPVAKSHPGRTLIPDHFPVEEQVIEPEEDTTGMVKIGEEVSEYVEYTPASLVRMRIIRPKYIDRSEGQTQDQQAKGQIDEARTEVLIAALPSRPIPKSIAGAGLLSWIIVFKFVDHLPFYRQSKRLKRDYNWNVSKSTINSWYIAVCTLMEPLYAELLKKMKQVDYLQADESKIKVLTKIPRDKNGTPRPYKQRKGGKQQLGWMWVLRDPINKYVLFNYEDNRSMKGAQATLDFFHSGYLQMDGWKSYNGIASRQHVQRLGCMAHLRRGFHKALKNDKKRAAFALGIIRQVYAHEDSAKDMTADERKAYREQHLRPLYTELKDWADEQAPLATPQSPIGKAFTYLQNQWSTMMTIFEDGRLLIDNNLIENKIRPLALGRKNYLFAGSHQAAQRAAMMYSFMATCKEHDVNPYQWLRDTLNKVSDTKRSELHTLLPGYKPDTDT